GVGGDGRVERVGLRGRRGVDPALGGRVGGGQTSERVLEIELPFGGGGADRLEPIRERGPLGERRVYRRRERVRERAAAPHRCLRPAGRAVLDDVLRQIGHVGAPARVGVLL